MGGGRRCLTIARMMVLVLACGVALAAYRSPALRTSLIFALIACWIASGLIRLSGVHPTRMRTIGLAAGLLALPSVGASMISQWMWGYPFQRPTLDHRILTARRIRTATWVNSEPDQGGGFVFVGDSTMPMARRLMGVPGDSNVYLAEAALVSLEANGLSPDDSDPIPDAGLVGIRRWLERTGQLDPGTSGDDRSRLLYGCVLEATGSDGMSLVFIAVSGGRASSGRFPYYECLFAGNARSETPRLLSFRRYYYVLHPAEHLGWFGLFWRLMTLECLVAVGVASSVSRYRSGPGNGESRSGRVGVPIVYEAEA